MNRKSTPEIPFIDIGRAVLTVLQPDQYKIHQQYYLENRRHLSRWEPLKQESYYSSMACKHRVELFFVQFCRGNAVHFAVLDHDQKTMLASCNFTNIVRGVFQACHLGFSVSHTQQGTGLMFEAASAGIRYMFNEMGLHRIMANHMPSNHRSARLLNRLGFEREGFAKSYLKIHGVWEDHVLTALINPD